MCFSTFLTWRATDGSGLSTSIELFLFVGNKNNCESNDLIRSLESKRANVCVRKSFRGKTTLLKVNSKICVDGVKMCSNAFKNFSALSRQIQIFR